MSQAPYMPVFTDALIGDTTHLSVGEFGAYCRILFATWRNNGKPFPDRDRVLRQIAGCNPGHWQKIRAAIAGFFDLSDGTWRQKRLEKEWARIARHAPLADSGVEKSTPQWSRKIDSTLPRKPLENQSRAPAREGETQNPNPDISKNRDEELGRRASAAPDGDDNLRRHTPEEIAQVENTVARLTAALQGKPPPQIHDPAAREAAVTANRFGNFVRSLNGWASEQLAGEERLEAWEVLAVAERAGGREAMSPGERRALDRLAARRDAAAERRAA